MKKLAVFFGVCACIFMVFPDVGGAADVEIVKLGINTTLTGRAAGYGLPIKRVLTMITNEWNEEGGIDIGGKRYRIELVVDDNKYQGPIAAQVAEKQILRDQVKAMFSVGTTVALGAGPVCQEHKTIFFCVGSATGKMIGKDKPYVFSFWVGREMYNLSMWRWFKNKFGIKTVVQVFPNDDAGWQGIKTNKEKAFPELGIKSLAEIPVEREAVDFSAVITKAISLNPDAIDFSGSTAQTALFMKQLGGFDYKGIKICGAPADAEKILEIAGKHGNGLYSTALFDVGPLMTPELSEFIRKYKAETGGHMDVLVESYLMMITAWRSAVEKAGTLDSEKVMNALSKVKIYNVLGDAELRGKEIWGIDRQAFYPMPISQVRDGHNYSVHTIPAEEIYKDLIK